MIEKAPGFRDWRARSRPGSLFDLLLFPFFMPFVPFVLFLFRLLETVPQAESYTADNRSLPCA